MQPDQPEQPDRPDDGAEGGPDDVAWRAIVENYGERAELEDPPPPVSDAPFAGRFGDPRALGDVPDEAVAAEVEDEDEDRYVPPPPPPLPRVEPDRLLAWAGVLGSPIVLLCALIFSISLPDWLGYLLVAGFVGGFLYLVLKMPREPRDPWDDGAQV